MRDRPSFISCLVKLVSNTDDQEFSLVAGKNTIGRALEGNSIVLTRADISRFHAEIELTESMIVVRDLGSSNGTRVNGIRVKEERLTEGAEIRLSPNCYFTLMVDRSRPPADAASSFDSVARAMRQTGPEPFEAAAPPPAGALPGRSLGPATPFTGLAGPLAPYPDPPASSPPHAAKPQSFAGLLPAKPQATSHPTVGSPPALPGDPPVRDPVASAPAERHPSRNLALPGEMISGSVRPRQHPPGWRPAGGRRRSVEPKRPVRGAPHDPPPPPKKAPEPKKLDHLPKRGRALRNAGSPVRPRARIDTGRQSAFDAVTPSPVNADPVQADNTGAVLLGSAMADSDAPVLHGDAAGGRAAALAGEDAAGFPPSQTGLGPVQRVAVAPASPAYRPTPVAGVGPAFLPLPPPVGRPPVGLDGTGSAESPPPLHPAPPGLTMLVYDCAVRCLLAEELEQVERALGDVIEKGTSGARALFAYRRSSGEYRHFTSPPADPREEPFMRDYLRLARELEGPYYVPDSRTDKTLGSAAGGVVLDARILFPLKLVAHPRAEAGVMVVVAELLPDDALDMLALLAQIAAGALLNPARWDAR